MYNVAFAATIGTGNWDVAYEVPRPVKQKFRDPGNPRPPVTRLRWKVLNYGYWEAQRNVYQIIQNASSVIPAVSGNRIDYPEIFSGIDVSYICRNVEIKEEIVLSQQTRNTLPDPTKYGLSRTNTYFVVAMEFLLTPNNINAFANRQAGKTPIKQGNNFFFDGDEPIDFEDADSTLQFFFPKDYAHAVGDSLTGFANRTSLRRYFYSQSGKHYMLVGVPYSWITGSPTGALIIDPTTSVATSEDVWLEDAYNKDGNGAGLLIGTAAGYPKKRTIIKFNIAGSGIPSSATVLNAQMKLYYYSANNGGSGTWVDRWVQAHQLLVNWAEAQATSINRLTGTPWNVNYVGLNDIDAKSSMESTLLCQQNYPRWQSWDLTSLTQKWVNLSATNYGVVLWATNEATDGYDLRFYSSEAVAPNDIYRPYLQVIYSTEATTKTVYFLKDHLGSIRATVLDSATAPVIGYDDYDPWGYALTLRTKAIPNAYLQGASKNKFTGKEYDDELGLNLYHFDWRPYDPLIGRWLSVDRQESSFTPYAYSFNNPLQFVDPDGKWPTGIHNRILQTAFRDLLTTAQIRILQEASIRVDRDQSAEGSFMHAMRSPNQTVEEAQQLMDDFIQERQNAFIEGEGNEALQALGEALHAIMDATSPAHEGFQVWYGLGSQSGLMNALSHALRERKITNAQLNAAARRVRQFYLESSKKKEEERNRREDERKKEEERKRKEEERKRKDEEKKRLKEKRGGNAQ